MSTGAVDQAADAAGRRSALLLSSDEVRIYDLEAGKRVAAWEGAGPWIDLSPDGEWVACTDGAVRQALSGAARWRAPFAGMPRFLDARRLVYIGRGELLLVDLHDGSTRCAISDDRLDPSAAAAVLFAAGRAVIVDPGGDGLVVADLIGERLLDLEGGHGAATSAAWGPGGALLVVQDGALNAWDLDQGRPLRSERPHGLQTLAVATDGASVATVGVEANDYLALRQGLKQVALPGWPPPTPALHPTPGGWLVEFWGGVLLAGPEGVRRTFRLPVGRFAERPRPIQANRGVLPTGPRLLLACDPPLAPYVYRLSDLSFQARLEPEEGE